LRSAGFRLIYEVHQQKLLVVAFGKRERHAVYKTIAKNKTLITLLFTLQIGIVRI